MSPLDQMHPLGSWEEILLSKTTKLPIIQDTKKKIGFILDFDRTLTYNFVDGSERASLISVLRAKNILTNEYAFAAYVLKEFFHPIEHDSTIDRSKKSEEMSRWWSTHLKLLSDKLSYKEFISIVGEKTISTYIENNSKKYTPAEQSFWRSNGLKNDTRPIPAGLTKEHIDQVVESGHIVMRDGYREFAEKCKQFNIPIVIMSANGLGTDSIRMYLEKQGLLGDQTFIISNEFVWDKNGQVLGYDGRVIHVFNKEFSILEKYPDIHQKMLGLDQLIVMGDSIGDAHMGDGSDAQKIIKIGLLTTKNPTKETIDTYNQEFDITLIGDGSMTDIAKILFENKI